MAPIRPHLEPFEYPGDMGGRYLIYVPEIAAHTVLFFYSKGPRSWSVRDYTTEPPTVSYAHEFSPDLSDEGVLELALRPGGLLERTKVHLSTDLRYWREVITTLNATLGLDPAEPTQIDGQHAAEKTRLQQPHAIATRVDATPLSDSGAHASAADLIAGGESQLVEFKETARFNENTGVADRTLEHEIVKAVAGFLNAAGGVLLIGVHDDQYPVGLVRDYGLTGNKGRDGFENWLVTKLETELGRSVIGAFVETRFESLDGNDVCRVDVRGSDRPIYAGAAEEFFVRMGNSTRPYNTRDAIDYIRNHW